MASSPFDLLNGARTESPVIISVPHAGRDYPSALPRLRVSIAAVRLLEDRYADRLAETAIACGITTMIARTPRLLIDLNRAETEIDPAMVSGAIMTGAPLSPRVRAGLGLIPRRLVHIGEIWRTPLHADELNLRIAEHHRPWHATLSQQLRIARAKFGAALLIDLHSMPPLGGVDAPAVVIGDRFGRSASPQLTAAAEAIFGAAGFRVTINAPYAGGHTIERHGAPAERLHALQVEIDRRTYLDEELDLPGPGLARMQALIAELVALLAEEIVPSQQLAAE